MEILAEGGYAGCVDVEEEENRDKCRNRLRKGLCGKEKERK